ncbi:CotY/CotZ family spore coat protein [Paraliobacillus salinarum]|uniref:CotY/CotZ family spore coat protein n=1 Tax=Paraliobacillus salinarum TaxID=1158996 RepID=UPI0015F766DF|nr:CotY/CotZ family spore coat protein [Paraliobacillus salinarum]
MLYEEKDGSIEQTQDDDKKTNDYKDCKDCKDCICEMLLDILEKQEAYQKSKVNPCSLLNSDRLTLHATVPFILQTPYGHPFFTWGHVGTDDCFITTFFRVIKVDCDQNCAVLQLLRPNVSIVDPETNCVEADSLCDVDFVTLTKECVLVDLSCYTSIKCISPEFVMKD